MYRTAVKGYIHRYLSLRWWAAIFQLMGELSNFRVTPSQLFQHMDIDYVNPIWLRTFPPDESTKPKRSLSPFLYVLYALVVYVCSMFLSGNHF